MKKSRVLPLLFLALPLLGSCQATTSSSSVSTSADYQIHVGEDSPLKAEFTSDFVLSYDNETIFTAEGIDVTFDGEPLDLSLCFFTFDEASPLEYVLEVDQPIELSVREADIDLRVGYIPEGSDQLYLSNSQSIHATNRSVLSPWVYGLFFLGLCLIFAGLTAFKAYMTKKNGAPGGRKGKEGLRSPVPEAGEKASPEETPSTDASSTENSSEDVSSEK